MGLVSGAIGWSPTVPMSDRVVAIERLCNTSLAWLLASPVCAIDRLAPILHDLEVLD